jgi:hypothetical protein
MNITRLIPEEPVRLDSDRLAELFVQLGEAGAQNVVSRAREELAVRLSCLEEAYDSGKVDVLCKGAKALVGISEQIGMNELALAARATQDCATGPDHVALAATMARMLRLGDCSLAKAWNLQGLSV